MTNHWLPLLTTAKWLLSVLLPVDLSRSCVVVRTTLWLIRPSARRTVGAPQLAIPVLRAVSVDRQSSSLVDIDRWSTMLMKGKRALTIAYGMAWKSNLRCWLKAGRINNRFFFFRASFLRFYFRFELRHSCDSRSNNNLTLRTSGFHLCCKRYIVVVAMIDSHIKMINLTEINNTVSSYDGGDRDNGEGYEYS